MRHQPFRELIEGAATPALLRGADRAAIADALRRAGAGATLRDLHDVLSRARVGILHRDLDARVLLANDAFCALVGRSADELDGVAFERFTHPDDVDRSKTIYRRQLAMAEPFEIEKRYQRPDGSSVWCAVHVSFVLADGRPRSTITVACDITARREAERELRESEEHHRYAVQLNPQISWIAGSDGHVIEVSPRWYGVTGAPPESALGDSWTAALHPEDRERTARRWAASVASGKSVDVEYRLRTADGSHRWFRARAAARRDDTGRVVRWYGTLEDIHARRVAENALRESEERFRLAAQAAGLGIWDYDVARDRREWSDEFKAMLGLDPAVEPAVETALARVVPDDRHLLQALVDAAEAGDADARFEVVLRIRRANDGAERWIRTDGWRMHTASGRLARVLVTMRDVTEERTAEARIRWAATHDMLTGIPNRARFVEVLEAAIVRAAPAHHRIALVVLDVDHLKEINDAIGHDAGDALLRTLAARLGQAFGPGAAIGRLGGDEFAVLVEAVTPDGLNAQIERALQAVAQPFDHDGVVCDCQATAGIATFPTDGLTAADLLKAADIALYAGKANRRGTLSIFAPEMRSGLQRRASMLNVARVAVRDDRVVPYYQPKVVLATGRVAGFEALLRWRHDLLGIQSPSTIAAAFEDYRLATLLGDAMLARIVRDIRGWLDAGLDPGRVAINLSPAEFRDEHLAARVLDPFRRAAIPLSRLEVEITETVLLGRDADRIAATLATFHRAGVAIALDDFGTGYASLTHLKAFPVDVIKIDQSFVAHLAEDTGDAAIVDAVIGLAHRLDMAVVAEGIETAAQARHLLDRGCRYGQGFLFSAAVPADAVPGLLDLSRARR